MCPDVFTPNLLCALVPHNKSKSQLRISGVSIDIFWITQFIIDFPQYLFTALVCFGVLIQIQIQKVVYFNCYLSEVQRFKGLKPCWAYLPPSFDHNIHIHDDLIIGKTVLVQTKNILTHWPLWDLGDLTDDKSTLFQATAWCPLTTSHYLRQCCLRSILLHDITRPQWVNKYNVNRMINYACLNLLCFRKSASIHNHFDLYSQNTIWHQLWTL